MQYETIHLDIDGPVARLSLDRPETLNAINARMIDELDHALDRIEADDGVLAVMLSGNGRAFCAGFDLKAGVAANRRGVKDWRRALEADRDIIMRLWNLSKPTVAAVHGYAVAAGFELALACDMTVCDRDAVFGEPELRFGSSIVALLLPWFTNPKRAKRILLTGQARLGAAEALELGIVNEVVDSGQYLERARALCREVTLMDADAVRLTKRAINRSYEIMGLQQALDMGVDTAVEIESIETDLRREFNRILREQGMQAALAWRENRLK
jgi:enoyl-CoA hydratase